MAPLPLTSEASSSPAVARLLQECAEHSAAALAPSTWEQYAAHFQWWHRFLLVFGLSAHLARPSEGALCTYAAFLARTCGAASVRQYLKGLKYFYSGMGVDVPWNSFHMLDRQLAGLKRLKGEGTHRKLPITPCMLVHFRKHLPAGSKWLAMLVCCLFGVFGMLRWSNLVVGGLALFGQAKHLTRADIVFDPHRCPAGDRALHQDT